MTKRKGEWLIPGVLQQGRVTVLTLAHDDTCPTLRTQRMEDCQCDPEVSLRMLPREPEK